MGNLIGGPHIWIILLIILLLFGAAKLPALAKSLGQSARVFKGEMKAMKEDGTPAADTPEDDLSSGPSTTAPAADRPADQDTPPRAS